MKDYSIHARYEIPMRKEKHIGRMPVFSKPEKMYCTLKESSVQAIYQIPIIWLRKEISVIIMT